MNKILNQKRNECLNLIRISSRIVNRVRTGYNEGKNHIELKHQVCKNLASEGKAFVTEAIFKTGYRADIVVLDDFKIIEIVSSEREKSLLNKAKNYPKGLKIEIKRCNDAAKRMGKTKI